MAWASDMAPYGSGTLAPQGALADAALAEQLRRYQRQIARRCRVVPADQVEQLVAEGPLQVSTKIDGQLWFLVARAGDCVLCAGNGRVLAGLPLLASLGRRLGGRSVIIAGELHALPERGRARVQHLLAVLGDGARATELCFRAVDLVEEDAVDGQSLPYPRRWERLQALLPEEHLVESVTVERTGLSRLYREWVLSERHEGLIARSGHGTIWKIKPAISLDLVVLAFAGRLIGECCELAELTLGLLTEEGVWQVVGSIDPACSAAERQSWHQRLEQLVVPSAHRMASSQGTLSRFVRPGIVVQVGCSDLLTLGKGGRPIRRTQLAFDGSAWQALGEGPSAELLHPCFAGERTDKTIDVGNVGLTQITSRVELAEDALGTAAPTPAGLPAATVLERRVWTRTTKGAVAVRKVLLVRTNKGRAAGYSPYAVFSTDFSPARKDPLRTEVTVAGDETTARAQVAEWIEGNVKRGWVEE